METTIARPADSSLISFDPIQILQQVVSIDSCDPPGGELEV
ncbi:hypothetical protein [Sinorhizobium medicae]|nr:hypothetical protein [Sinorhizobium medicae]WQO88481.1 hypothetical protein U8C37_21185 [Sinorhizobium medicae]